MPQESLLLATTGGLSPTMGHLPPRETHSPWLFHREEQLRQFRGSMLPLAGMSDPTSLCPRSSSLT